jgi:hypothetical protein
MASDGAGGAFVVWQGGGDGAWNIYAARVWGDAPTPVLASLVGAEATPERVRLEWQCGGAGGASASVERRTASSVWRRLATVVADGAGRVVFEDRAVEAGAPYGYRLVLFVQGREAVAGETWLTVPARVELALRGPRPNPSDGALVVAFSLPDDRPARLELLDTAGRRVLEQALGAPGPGEHVARIAAAPSLPPGLYFVRLRHGDRTLTARCAIAR